MSEGSGSKREQRWQRWRSFPGGNTDVLGEFFDFVLIVNERFNVHLPGAFWTDQGIKLEHLSHAAGPGCRERGV